jgi:hypothetical protein
MRSVAPADWAAEKLSRQHAHLAVTPHCIGVMTLVRQRRFQLSKMDQKTPPLRMRIEHSQIEYIRGMHEPRRCAIHNHDSIAQNGLKLTILW